jgi:hypothetical protein
MNWLFGLFLLEPILASSVSMLGQNEGSEFKKSRTWNVRRMGKVELEKVRRANYRARRQDHEEDRKDKDG